MVHVVCVAMHSKIPFNLKTPYKLFTEIWHNFQPSVPLKITEGDYYFMTRYKRPNVSFLKNPIRNIEEFLENGYVGASKDDGWVENKREKIYLKPGEKPDVTRMKFTSTTLAVKIEYSEPLEHELIPGPGITEAHVEKMSAARAFPSFYLFDMVKIDFDKVLKGFGQKEKEKEIFIKDVKELIRYGVNYAGFPAKRNGTPLMKPEDMLYGINFFNEDVYAFGVNMAFLEEAKENNNGKIWHKTNWNDLKSFYSPE